MRYNSACDSIFGRWICAEGERLWQRRRVLRRSAPARPALRCAQSRSLPGSAPKCAGCTRKNARPTRTPSGRSSPRARTPSRRTFPPNARRAPSPVSTRRRRGSASPSARTPIKCSPSPKPSMRRRRAPTILPRGCWSICGDFLPVTVRTATRRPPITTAPTTRRSCPTRAILPRFPIGVCSISAPWSWARTRTATTP